MIGSFLFIVWKALNKIFLEESGGQSSLAHGHQGVCSCPSLTCELSFLNTEPLTKGFRAPRRPLSQFTLPCSYAVCLHPQPVKSCVPCFFCLKYSSLPPCVATSYFSCSSELGYHFLSGNVCLLWLDWMPQLRIPTSPPSEHLVSSRSIPWPVQPPRPVASQR